jgi:hypothetical protein
VAVGVVLEVGTKRVFASALDWPGWSRAGKDETGALEALAGYAARYGAVAERAGLKFPARGVSGSLTVAEWLAGSATTDFGAPGAIAAAERQPPTRRQAERLADLLVAAWGVLDDIAAAAPVHLRRGPRGGGRDRDAIVQHVLAAEASYVRKVGLRLPEPPAGDRIAIAAFRGQVAAAVRHPGSIPPPGPRSKPWPMRYFVRRTAWHALDHAWEIEDRGDDRREDRRDGR